MEGLQQGQDRTGPCPQTSSMCMREGGHVFCPVYHHPQQCIAKPTSLSLLENFGRHSEVHVCLWESW